MRTNNQRHDAEEQRQVSDGDVAFLNFQPALVQPRHEIGKAGFASLAFLRSTLGAFRLDASVTLQVHQGAGYIAVMVVQQCDGFLIADAAFAADQFDVLNGVSFHKV